MHKLGAAVEELPDVVTVLDPFHVTRLAGEALDKCRRRVQQAICGHRGRKGDPLYAARRTLSTGADLLNDKQKDAIMDGTLLGSITQNPVGIGKCVVESLAKAIKGEKLPKVVDTGYYWYDKSNMNDAKVAAVLYD